MEKKKLFFNILCQIHIQCVCAHLLQWLFTEWTADVVVKASLETVFAKRVTTRSRDWFMKQPAENKPCVLQLTKEEGRSHRFESGV